MSQCAFVYGSCQQVFSFFFSASPHPNPTIRTRLVRIRILFLSFLVVTGLKLLNIAAAGAFGKSFVNECRPVDKRPEFQTFMTAYLAGAVSTRFGGVVVVLGHLPMGNAWKIALLFHYAI
jgi:hypothetical protein